MSPSGQLLTVGEIFGAQCTSLSLTQFYISAFAWSAMVITGLGGTDLYPSQDQAETVIVTVMVVMGALMWAKVLATFCELATNSDPAALEYRQVRRSKGEGPPPHTAARSLLPCTPTPKHQPAPSCLHSYHVRACCRPICLLLCLLRLLAPDSPRTRPPPPTVFLPYSYSRAYLIPTHTGLGRPQPLLQHPGLSPRPQAAAPPILPSAQAHHAVPLGGGSHP